MVPLVATLNVKVALPQVKFVTYVNLTQLELTPYQIVHVLMGNIILILRGPVVHVQQIVNNVLLQELTVHFVMMATMNLEDYAHNVKINVALVLDLIIIAYLVLVLKVALS